MQTLQASNQNNLNLSDDTSKVSKFSNSMSMNAIYSNSYLNNSTNMHLINKLNSEMDDMKIHIFYSGLITVIYFKEASGTGFVELANFLKKIREICKFDESQPFTLKWVDEEGDPCTVSSQIELDEAIRLYYLNKESELMLHVFANVPQRPGIQCAGEDRSIYRRGARRWRKIYLVNGHKYQAKRFARTALCRVCQDRIWGLGRQGYKCLDCKTMVHKRCHKFITSECSELMMHGQRQTPTQSADTRQEPQHIPTSATFSSISSNLSGNELKQKEFNSRYYKHLNSIYLLFILLMRSMNSKFLSRNTDHV